MAAIRDHTGKEFPDVRTMCAYHGVSTAMFYRSRKNGDPLSVVLSSRRTHYKYNGHIFVHKEGLLAYAGARRYEDIAHKVQEIIAEP